MLTFLILFFIILLAGFLALFFYRKSHHYKKQIERSLKMVPFLVTIPQVSGQDKAGGTRDEREVARELVSIAENFYYNLYSIYQKGFKNFLVGQKHLALEIVAQKGEICFYVAVPASLVSLVEKSLSSQYPEANIVEIEEHNIFYRDENIQNITGGEFYLKKSSVYPIKTYKSIEAEPLEMLTNSLSKLEENEGAAIQILIKPESNKFAKGARKIAEKIQKGEHNDSKATKAMGGLANEFFKTAVTGEKNEPDKPKTITQVEEEAIKRIGEKASKPVFETLIRIIASSPNPMRSEMIQSEIAGTFQQFNDFNLNRFGYRKISNKSKLVSDYIFRFFDSSGGLLSLFSEHNKIVLNTEELASIFHLPNYLIDTPGIKWLPTRQTAAPVTLPGEGTILGESNFRGESRDVKLALNDKRRHVYIIGQTGTGKTNTLKNMILDDIYKGNGLCYIDPHGQDIEDIINKIPKERAEDVIIFDAGDTERPIGLNLFEATTTEEKDFVIQETIQMFYKLYDPGHTGIVGPRFEHWLRNSALTIMADPEGATFIEVPKIFTDNDYLKRKLQYVQDPIVRNFWLGEMAQTADFHKSEILGWFQSKFGAFANNSTMRNILGQVKSGLNIREAMDSGKIVLVNLAKGKVGELNMQVLGMILVSKFQMAAMGRIDMPEDQRRDFTLYVDEFQNFATDSFAAILSEARKFRLSLVVANQFIGQLRPEIKDAVFGNVGTLVSFRIGPEDGEFMEKQFTPVFKVSDLINIENYHAFVKLMINGVPTRPFSIKGKAPMGEASAERGAAIKELARLKYGRARVDVDREILERIGDIQYPIAKQ